MDIAITLLGIIGFTLRLSFVVSGLLFLWWRKEYRLDRMYIHLRTKQGKHMLFGKSHIVLGVLLAAWFLVPLQQVIEFMLSLGVFAMGLSYVRHMNRWPLPPISPKVFVFGGSVLIATGLTLLFAPFPPVVSLAFVDILVFPFSALVVLGLSVPTYLYHALVIYRALRIYNQHTPMTVVGITGSYGKTSVKEYLSTIISKKYPTLKTEASKNSPIGIAEVILRSLRPKHRVFVVEMGAYKRGEISSMSSMVKPQVAILTAINPQHQDLFGSIETTMKAKYELIQGLAGGKIAIINLDDPRVRKMGLQAQSDGSDVWGYALSKKSISAYTGQLSHVFWASDTEATFEGISFRCHFGSSEVLVTARVLGVHQIQNLLAAIAGAVASGMTFEEACRSAKEVSGASKVMESRRGINGSVFIDDTFNNNPDAADAAIRFLGQMKGKKILVFQPMIELGSYAASAHEAVGKIAGSVCDTIFLTNRNYFDDFSRGVRGESENVLLRVASPSQVAAYIRSHVGKGDAVLFKGKDAEHALKLLV